MITDLCPTSYCDNKNNQSDEIAVNSFLGENFSLCFDVLGSLSLGMICIHVNHIGQLNVSLRAHRLK